MLELKGLSLGSADHLISAAVSSFFQHPVPNTLCRPRPCLRDLCQTFLSEARAGKVPDLLRTTFEKGVSHPRHSAPQWLHVIYRKRQQFQGWMRNALTIPCMEWKLAEASEDCTESTLESIHGNHRASPS